MEKIEFEVDARAVEFDEVYLCFPNGTGFTCFHKYGKLDRKLHVHKGDKFKVTIEKVAK